MSLVIIQERELILYPENDFPLSIPLHEAAPPQENLRHAMLHNISSTCMHGFQTQSGCALMILSPLHQFFVFI